MRKTTNATNAQSIVINAIMKVNALSAMNLLSWWLKVGNVLVSIRRELLFILKIVWFKLTFTIWNGDKTTPTYSTTPHLLIALKFSISHLMTFLRISLVSTVLVPRDTTLRIELMLDFISITWQSSWFMDFPTALLICIWILIPIQDLAIHWLQQLFRFISRTKHLPMKLSFRHLTTMNFLRQVLLQVFQKYSSQLCL